MHTRTRKVAVYATLVVTLGFLLFPIYWILLTSIRPRGEILAVTSLFPDFKTVSFSIYGRIFLQKPLVRWIINSIIVTGGTTLAAVFVSVCAGYALSRFQYRENRIMGYLFLVIRMLPSVLLVIPLYIIFMRIKVLNTHVALILAYVTYIIPFGVWLMKSFFDSIPIEIDDAAKVDGCGILGTLVRVVLPVAAPGVAATAIYCAVLAWSDYLFSVTFMQKTAGMTLTVGITTFITEVYVEWNGLMAGALVASLPLVVAFVVLEKYLVRGLAAGAIK